MKKWLSACLVIVFISILMLGCSANNNEDTANQNNEPQVKDQQETEKIRLFRGPIEKLPQEDNKYAQFLAEKTGVHAVIETAPWEGGVTYAQKLQTMLASGDIPDAFRSM